MKRFGTNPTLMTRLAMPAGGAALAVVAVLAVNALGGISGETSASPTALDELAAAIEALEARQAAALEAAPRPAALPAQPAPAAAGAEPLLLPAEGALAAVQANLAWSSMNPANIPPASPADKLAALVAASAAVPVAQDHAAEGSEADPAMEGHGADAHGDHDMMMEMMAPDPSLSACTNEIKTMADRAQIHFESGSTELDLRARAITAIIARKAAACPQARITVEGFADPTGDYALNTRIALARAENTLRELTRFAGRSEGFSATSHFTGDSHPDFCPHYDVVDRRVEFHVEEAQMSLAKAD